MKCDWQFGSRAGDIRVENEEGSVVLAENVTGEGEGTSCESGVCELSKSRGWRQEQQAYQFQGARSRQRRRSGAPRKVSLASAEQENSE
jgi:hypothetical protein